MNKLNICSIFVAFALVVVMPSAFASHPKVEVSIPPGVSSPGCEITSECFSPAEVTTDVGGEVIWSNDDTAGHTVTSGTLDGGPDGIFDSSLFMAGKTFSHKFEEAGKFPYFCVVHPWMTGTVVVQEAGVEEHEESEIHATAASADGSILVKVGSGKPTSGEELSLTVEFGGTDGSPIEHVNYDISATQDGAEVLNEAGKHSMTGVDELKTDALSSDSPVDVQVIILGLGPEEDEATWTGPKGDIIKVQVVPEFGQVAAMVLAASIVSIVAVTARSKVIPRL
ncbi:MAG: PEFG-CTERM sorting domain-containing protein [Thaumarchaeota archaeon]|nr:PEFG-CTERM sorting domain-containing protein [Nitrososphaerota archaeon]